MDLLSLQRNRTNCTLGEETNLRLLFTSVKIPRVTQNDHPRSHRHAALIVNPEGHLAPSAQRCLLLFDLWLLGNVRDLTLMLHDMFGCILRVMIFLRFNNLWLIRFLSFTILKILKLIVKKIVKVEVDKLGVFQVILAVCIRKTFLG